jgi:hypothetical protein
LVGMGGSVSRDWVSLDWYSFAQMNPDPTHTDLTQVPSTPKPLATPTTGAPCKANVLANGQSMKGEGLHNGAIAVIWPQSKSI